MAGLKDIKKKITSISNTRKITRTMEMVAAAKSKQTIDRVEASTPYSSKLTELLNSLTGGQNVDHFLVREKEKVQKSALLVVTANRGLCGGYNTNVANLAEKWVRAEEAEGREAHVMMVGKKGISRFRFRKVEVAEKRTDIEDKPSFSQAAEIADGFIESFRKGEVDRVMVAVTRYHSAVVQQADLFQLLPIIPPETDEADGEEASQQNTDFIFEPDPEKILEDLLPFSVKHTMYRLLLEAAAGEQIARRVAMKLATDNAGELTRFYTGKYNRERQASITQQIMEIVGGAEALD
ncbi:MAG: ATP synthase F1 subunit gamma [Planctomycetota bacterium]|nr:ATP synthase F1 subunit gamma [Planctomycetota bacterium]|tara:strand:+ start:140 stop:1021 length:882 start_codon:yes stop_codon:yes gene_type:complete